MTPRNEVAVDGVRSDGVGHTSATPEQLAGYGQAAEQLGQLRTPVLLDVNNVNQRLYIQAFDGTGNNKFKDPDHATNVAKISDQLEGLREQGHPQLRVDYQVGPGTQDAWHERPADLVRGHTYQANVEE